VKNMPGAGHLIGANAIYASRPNGLTIGTFNTGLIYNQLIGARGVRFDLSKMSWVGKAASEPRVIVIASQSPIKTFADLRAQKTPVNFATSGIGSANYVEITSLTHVLNLPIKILTGYNGNDDQLAMRRGEVVGSSGSRSSFEQFIKNGYGRFIAQIGGSEKDVPQLKDLVKDPDAQSIIALIQSQGDLARLTAGPPGIPADRLAALREAYRKALQDPELKAKAEKAGRPVDPAYGDDVLKLIKAALDQKPQMVTILKSAMEKKAPLVQMKGTISAYDGRKKFTLKMADGKTFAGEISGSRTQITVGGKKAKRSALKVGMSCTVAVAKGAKEAKSISCG
jgi:putative tricarboxylic transport membrane protein